VAVLSSGAKSGQLVGKKLNTAPIAVGGGDRKFNHNIHLYAYLIRERGLKVSHSAAESA
jgi:hypothetical protein